LKNVVAKTIADELHLDEDIIFKNMMEVINEERQKDPTKQFIIDENTRQIYVFEEEDINYINNSEKNTVSFLELATYFEVDSSSMSWFLDELLKQNKVTSNILDYLQTVKNKPEIKVYFEPIEVNVDEEFFLVFNVNTETEILEPEISLNTPSEIDILYTPTLPKSYNQGRHISRYQLKSIKHGKYILDTYFKGLIEGKIFSEKINLSELWVKALPPEIYAEKVPRSKTFYGDYDTNTEIVFRISNRGTGEAFNVQLKGINTNLRVISGDTIGKIGVKARIDHPIVLRPKKSGEILLDELYIAYEDGDGKEYRFSIPEIVFNVTTLQPELKIEVNSRKNVNQAEIFPVDIRVTNIGKGIANQVRITVQLDPANSLLSGSLNNYFRRINPGASIQISYELRAPNSGKMNMEFENLEYRDQEGNILST